MDNGELLKYNQKTNKFEIFRNDEKSMILQNLLSLLVDSETSEKESENFDLVKNIFQLGEKTKNKSSKNKKPYNDYEVIRELYEKINKLQESEKIENKEKPFLIENNFSFLKIDYPGIISINTILISIIKLFADKKQIEFEGNICNLLGRNFQKLKFLTLYQTNLLQDFETIKTIEIKLSRVKYDNIINLEYILLFCIFFKMFFPYVLNITLSLNCDSIDKFFFHERNPYRIVEKLAMKIGKKNERILIANWIISKLLTRDDNILNLKLNVNDSYVVELNETTANRFIFVNKNEEGFHSYDLMKITLLDSFLNLNNLYAFDCNFNSLDSVLFEKVNLMMIKNISIASLSLNLFPKNLKFNTRKIFLNQKYFYQNANGNCNETLVENPENDLYCDLISMDTLKISDDKFLTFSDSKILKILFEKFNENLRNLILILESKIRKLKYLKIDINPFGFMTNYDFFNCSVACFIYDVLKIISNPINRNFIDLSEFGLSSNNLIFDFSTIKEKNDSYFDLSEVKINNLNLNLNFLKILNFENLPNEYLTNLTLNEISAETFSQFQKFLYNKFHVKNEVFMNNLLFLNISVTFCSFSSEQEEEKFFETVCDLFKFRLPFNLEEITITIKKNINIEYLLKIVYNIKRFAHKQLKKVILHLNLKLVNDTIKNFPNFSNKEFFLEDTQINYDNNKFSILIDTYKINNISINHLFALLFGIKKTKVFLHKLNSETIIIQLVKFLFSKKNKRVEINTKLIN